MSVTSFPRQLGFRVVWCLPLRGVSSTGRAKQMDARTRLAYVICPTAGPPSVEPSVEARRLVDADAVDERGEDRRLANRSRTLVKQVAVDDREVGEPAHLEGSRLVEMVRVRGPGRERGERVHELEPLVREERLALAARLVA